MNSVAQQDPRDDMDLCDVIAMLWRRKLLIFAVTALFSLTGAIYAYIAPQEWRAQAIVAKPSFSEMEHLLLRLEKIATIMKENKLDKLNDPDNHINIEDKVRGKDQSVMLGPFKQFSPDKLFFDFIQSYESFDNIIEFVKTMPTGRHQHEGDERLLMRSLDKQLPEISVKHNKNEKTVTLTLVADNAHDAVTLLHDYINFVQSKEEAIKNKELAGIIANRTKAVALEYHILQEDAFKRLQEEIERTELALRISRNAGINNPVENLRNQNFFQIDLGAKALSEQLNVLKEIKKPELISQRLVEIRLQLDSLQALQQGNVNFASYHFLQSPQEPLNREKPKRVLVIALATLTGCIMAMVLVLFHSFWLLNKSSNRENPV